MKHSIALTMFTYNSRLIGEGGFTMKTVHELNNEFPTIIKSFIYKPRGFLPGTIVHCSCYVSL